MTEYRFSEKFYEEVKNNNPFIVLQDNYQGMHQCISCKCEKCGFPGNAIWKPWPQTLLKPEACPVCAGRKINSFYKGFNDLETWCLKNNRPDILADWDYTENEKDDSTPSLPSDIARSNPRTRCHWRCQICGTLWLTTPNKRTSYDKRTGKTSSCPHCSKAGTSFSELAIIYYLQIPFSDIVIRSREIIGKELDIYLPSKRIAIECDGYIYHKDRLDADNEKDALCRDNKIHLIRFREPRLSKTESATIIWSSGVQDATSFESGMNKLMDLCGVKNPPSIDIKRDYSSIISNYKRTIQEHSLLTEFPEIAKEWHPTKNGTLKPENFTPGEDYYAWWECSKCGHSWQAHIYMRTGSRHTGCPKCKLKQQGQTYRQNRAKKMNLEQWCNDHNMHNLLLEWDYEANLKDPDCPDTPKECPYGSPNDVHWICSQCGHKWIAPPVNRRNGRGVCVKCINRLFIPGQNDLKTWCLLNKKRSILDDWDYAANLTDPKSPNRPEEVRYNQSVSVHWKCHVCGHLWQGNVNGRTKKNKGCKDCSYKIRHQKKVKNLDTGVVYESLKDAELKTSGRLGTNICQCCKGIHKTAYGYHWAYVED